MHSCINFKFKSSVKCIFALFKSLIYLFVPTAMNESVVVADADDNVYAKECYERKSIRFKFVILPCDSNCDYKLTRLLYCISCQWVSFLFLFNKDVFGNINLRLL